MSKVVVEEVKCDACGGLLGVPKGPFEVCGYCGVVNHVATDHSTTKLNLGELDAPSLRCVTILFLMKVKDDVAATWGRVAHHLEMVQINERGFQHYKGQVIRRGGLLEAPFNMAERFRYHLDRMGEELSLVAVHLDVTVLDLFQAPTQRQGVVAGNRARLFRTMSDGRLQEYRDTPEHNHTKRETLWAAHSRLDKLATQVQAALEEV